LEEACGAFLASTFKERFENDRDMLMSPSFHLGCSRFALRVYLFCKNCKIFTIIFFLLKSDDLNAENEHDIFEAVLQYASQTVEKRDGVLEELLPHIRFSCMAPKALVKIEENKAVKHLPLLHTLLYRTYRDRTLGKSIVKTRASFCRFDENEKSSSISLSEDGLTATNNGSSWMSVRCVQPFGKRDYFEFKINNYNLMIGVVEGTCSYSSGSYPGSFSNGWTVHYDGNMYHSGTPLVIGLG